MTHLLLLLLFHHYSFFILFLVLAMLRFGLLREQDHVLVVNDGFSALSHPLFNLQAPVEVLVDFSRVFLCT